MKSSKLTWLLVGAFFLFAFKKNQGDAGLTYEWPGGGWRQIPRSQWDDATKAKAAEIAPTLPSGQYKDATVGSRTLRFFAMPIGGSTTNSEILVFEPTGQPPPAPPKTKSVQRAIDALLEPEESDEPDDGEDEP